MGFKKLLWLGTVSGLAVVCTAAPAFAPKPKQVEYGKAVERGAAWLKQQQIPVTVIETPGRHTWMVWRDNLIHFTPLLFQH